MNKLKTLASYGFKYMPLIMLVSFFYTDISFAKEKTIKDLDKAWAALMGEYQGIVYGVTGIAILTSILIFIVHFIQLGATAGNSSARRKVLNNLWISGICTALLGAVTVIYAIVFSTSW